MADSTLTVKLVDASTVTTTITTADWPDAQKFCQNLTRTGGLFDNNGVWHPVSAILSITIS